MNKDKTSYAVLRLNMEETDEVVELDSLFIHQLWTPQPYFQHSKVRKIFFFKNLEKYLKGKYRDELITPTESLHIWPNKTVQYYTIIALEVHCRLGVVTS